MKTQKPTRTIFGTGLIALDAVFSESDKQPKLWAGGTCGNVLTILSFLGWKSFPIARLNGDPASRLVKKDMEKWGVRLDFASLEPTSHTPVVIQRIKRNSAGQLFHRFSWHCPKCGGWLPTYKPVLASAAGQVAARLGTPTVFFMDRLSCGALALAQVCAANGAVVVFEPSGLGDKKLFRQALEVSHIVKYSSDRITHLNEFATSKAPLLQIETLGAEGLRFKCHTSGYKTDRWQELEAFRITGIKDAAGAGDWCTAGILDKAACGGLQELKRLSKRKLQDALRFGQALATWNCRFEGARGGMYVTSRNRFDEEIQKILAGNPSVPRPEPSLRLASNILECFCPRCRGGNGVNTGTRGTRDNASTSRLGMRSRRE
jgi:fructokinase